MESPSEHLSDIIGQIYDAAIEENLWAGMAVKIAGAFDSSSAVLKIYSSSGDVSLVECTDNMVLSESQREWGEYWHRNDLWVSRTVALGMSRVITDENLVSRGEQQGSAFYHDWLKTLDIYHVVGATFPIGDGLFGALGIHRTKQAGAFEEDDRRNATLFLPHLQRALRLGHRLAAVANMNSTGVDILERIDVGILIVDVNCRIIRANGLAEQILRSTVELRVSGGRLAVADAPLQNRLSASVRGAVATAGGRPNSSQASLAIFREGRLPLTLAVSPLPDRTVRFHQQAPGAIIFLRDPECPGLQIERLRDLFGLTKVEAAVASLLAIGQSVEDIAARRNIGVETVRSHIKKILAKTGTRRQAEATALMARSVAGISG